MHDADGGRLVCAADELARIAVCSNLSIDVGARN